MIDLYSDTRTRPTPGMRRAMAEAEVGDEQAMLDPTVNALCERVADLLGKEAALYLPSGTMCNQIAARSTAVRATRSSSLRRAHPILAESGGPAGLAGVMLRGLEGERGMFTAAQVRAAINSPAAPCAALAPARGREHDQRRRWRGLAAGRDRGGDRGRQRARSGLPHGRRAADERGGR